MSDKHKQVQLRSEPESVPLRRRGGWLRKTAAPIGKRPLGPPSVEPSPAAPGAERPSAAPGAEPSSAAPERPRNQQ